MPTPFASHESRRRLLLSLHVMSSRRDCTMLIIIAACSCKKKKKKFGDAECLMQKVCTEQQDQGEISASRTLCEPDILRNLLTPSAAAPGDATRHHTCSSWLVFALRDLPSATIAYGARTKVQTSPMSAVLGPQSTFPGTPRLTGPLPLTPGEATRGRP